MRPVRTERSNKVFTAPAGQEYEVRDLHVEVDLDEIEREKREKTAEYLKCIL